MLIINVHKPELTQTHRYSKRRDFVCSAVFPHHIYSELTCKTIIFPKPSLYICQFTKCYMVHVQLLCRLLNTHIQLFIVSILKYIDHVACLLSVLKYIDHVACLLSVLKYIDHVACLLSVLKLLHRSCGLFIVSTEVHRSCIWPGDLKLT